MNLWRYVLVLWLMAPLALAQPLQQSQPASRQPKALIQSLYQQVVARHPIGMPEGTDMKIFAPYLSETLLHRIDLAAACGADWYRQYPNPQLKPPLGWLELGLFSGSEEEHAPSSFVVERAQTEKDGSIHVYVKLTYEEPGERPWTWQVAPIVRSENGHYVVDDVIYLKHDRMRADARLSALIAEGCDGPRWVGFSRNSKDDKPHK